MVNVWEILPKITDQSTALLCAVALVLLCSCVPTAGQDDARAPGYSIGASADLGTAAKQADQTGNYAEAIRLYKQIEAQGGDIAVYARFKLGGYYLMGAGVPRDEAVAAAWYNKAISTGRPPYLAYWTLGIMYHYGAGVPKDEAKARDLLQRGNGPGPAPIIRLMDAGMLPNTFEAFEHFDVNAAITQLNARAVAQQEVQATRRQEEEARKPDWEMVCASNAFRQYVQRCSSFVQQSMMQSGAGLMILFLEPQRQPAMVDLCAYHLTKHEASNVQEAVSAAVYESHLNMDKMVAACEARR